MYIISFDNAVSSACINNNEIDFLKNDPLLIENDPSRVSL